MRPLWLIEADAFGSSVERLKAEIRRQGMIFGVVRHESFTSGLMTRVADRDLDPDDCVIFVGTWPLWRHMQLHWSSWIPGGWCATENLDCRAYYPQFGRFLLNQHWSIMSGIEAIERQQDLMAQFGRDGEIFVRPTGCLKIFNGRCVDAKSFSSALAPSRYDPSTSILVAEPRPIGREWRFVVADHRPIAVSQYHDAGTKCLRQGSPPEVLLFVETVLAEVAWEPDEVFVMDVCESEGKIHVVELNGFSCAGLYDCNLTNIVAKVSEIAERSWRQKNRSSEPSGSLQ